MWIRCFTVYGNEKTELNKFQFVEKIVILFILFLVEFFIIVHYNRFNNCYSAKEYSFMRYTFKFKLFGNKVQMFDEGQMGIVIEKEPDVICIYPAARQAESTVSVTSVPP